MKKKALAEKREPMMTQTDLLYDGWTKTMIKKLLPEPILKRNPRYACAPEMKLWKKADIEAIMLSDEYQIEKAKADKRKKAANKAIDTKLEKTEAKLQKNIDDIVVEKIPLSELRALTLEERDAYYSSRNLEYLGTAKYADAETIERWMVNYIRHELTNYNYDLFHMQGLVGCHEAYYDYKVAVMNKIADTYPELKDECERQIQRIFTTPSFR